MMIWKTSPLKFLFFKISFILIGAGASAYAQSELSHFDCLLELISVTERASLQRHRNGVEAPFLVENMHLIFPQASVERLIGFFVYSRTHAEHYDSVIKAGGQQVPLRELDANAENGIYRLVAQPEGLRTVILPYLPGFEPVRPVGNSVMGSLLRKKSVGKTVYYDPSAFTATELKQWLDLKGISTDGKPLPFTHVRLVSSVKLAETDLMEPFEREIEIRKSWIKKNNLDRAAFKKLNIALKSVCKE